MPFHDVIGHERPKAILQTALRHDRVAHAYLLHGDDGIGKKLLALRFAQAINCESGDGLDACGACRSCRQFETRTHPDFLVIEPDRGLEEIDGELVKPDREVANPQIKIEQIREVEHAVVYQPLVGRKKMIIIDEADRMTLQAANALLKTLEEPPGHSVLLLVCSRPSALPATVRSRCQVIRFAPPARTQVEAALVLKRELPPADARLLALASQGRIGHALAMDLKETRKKQDEYSALVSPGSLQSITTILTAAEALYKDRGRETIEWLAQWVRDILLTRIGADQGQLLHRDRLPLLTEAAGRARVDQLLDLLDEIDAAQRAATRNLNVRLTLEILLLRLRAALGLASEARPAR